MEHKMHEKSRQTILNFKCDKIITHRVKTNSAAIKMVTNEETCEPEKNEEAIGSPTPDKAPQRSCRRYNKKLEALQLPDSFQIIGDLFDGMESSIKLLRLCKTPSTFKNVSSQVEILKRRMFLHNHLSQMMYIMPDLIHIEKICVHDQNSFCMVPDLKVTLLPITTIEHTDLPFSKSEAGDSKDLRNLFQARLHKFFQAHPEALCIPEVTLPEPFNSRCNNFLSIETPSSVAAGSGDDMSSTPSSYFSSSFQHRLSPIVELHEELKASLLSSLSPNSFTGHAFNVFMEHSSPIKVDSNFEKMKLNACATSIKSHSIHCSLVKHPPTPVRTASNVAGEMVRKVSAELRSSVSINPRRALNFTGEDAERNFSEQILQLNEEYKGRNFPVSELGLLDKPLVDGGTDGRIPAAFPEKVQDNENQRTMGYKDETVSTCRDMLLCLPGLFTTICRIRWSVKCTFVTKQELLHKILTYNSEMLEPSVIEEQLKLLEELVPEWISQKMTPSGDLLYCISRSSDAKAIYARLVEAA